MNYLKSNRMKLLGGLVVLFLLFQVYKFVSVRIVNVNLPKGRIAFSSGIDGDDEIYIMNINGTRLKQLTKNSVTKTNPYADDEPSFSPDGSKIVFRSDRQKEMDYHVITNTRGRSIGEVFSGGAVDIYFMNSDGTNQKPLTSQDLCSDPFFYPDSKKIVFKSKRSKSIRMIDIYTGELRIMSSGYGGSCEFSKDGMRVFDNFDSDISITDITGINRMKLTHFSDSGSNQDNRENRTGIAFTLSPEGEKIAFVTIEERDGQLCRLFKFYTMNTNGSNLIEINELETKSLGTISDFKYSPDRDKIIFVFNSDKQRMYSLDLVTGGLTDLTDKKENWVRFPWFNFTFTPDGKRIVFIGDIVPKNYPVVFFSHLIKGWIRYIFLRRSTPSYDNNYLCIMDLDGKNYRRITKLPEGTELGRDFIHWEK